VVFGPGNGSPSATNVVLVVLVIVVVLGIVVIRFSKYQGFFHRNRSSLNFASHTIMINY